VTFAGDKKDEAWSQRYLLGIPDDKPEGRARAESILSQKQMNLVAEVQDFLREHEHSEVLEERWRTNFSTSLGILGRKVDRTVEGIERKVDQRMDGVKETLEMLAERMREQLGELLFRHTESAKDLGTAGGAKRFSKTAPAEPGPHPLNSDESGASPSAMRSAASSSATTPVPPHTARGPSNESASDSSRDSACHGESSEGPQRRSRPSTTLMQEGPRGTTQELSVIFSGWIHKKGAVNTAFQRRFLVLYNEGTVAWFEDVPNSAPSIGVVTSAKGTAQVEGATITTDESASVPTRSRFKLLCQERVGRGKLTVSSLLSSAAGERAMVMEVDSQEERDAWVSALRLLAGRKFDFN